MDEINKIRKEYRVDGRNRHELAQKYNRSWNTIDAYVKIPREELADRGKRPGREATVVTAVALEEIRRLLKEEILLKVRRKQRYTAAYIFKKLVEKGIYEGSYRRIRAVVRAERSAMNQTKVESSLPLTFTPGFSLQVDHGEFDVIIDGERCRGYLFVASVPGLVIRFCQAYPVKAQEAWGAFHEGTFRFFNGVFHEVIYDNDTVLVRKIIGVERKQTDFAHSLAEHYGFESIFCNKGAGKEKGAVENAVGFCRRNYLAGLPEYSSWRELNRSLEQVCETAIEGAQHYRTGKSISDLLKETQRNLLPLPIPRGWVQTKDLKVNGYQVVVYAEHWYSVPERYVGSELRVRVSVFEIKMYDGNECIAQHMRRYLPGDDSLLLEHYLDALSLKPGALWDCTAVQNHCFGDEFIEVWNRLYSRYEKREANKEFIKILLLGRTYSQDVLSTAVAIAVEYGSVGHDSVLTIASQLTSPSPESYLDADWFKELNPSLSGECDAGVFDLDIYADLHRLEARDA